MENLLENYPQVVIEKNDIEKFFNGVKIEVTNPDGIYKVLFNNKFIGSGIVESNKIKRDIIVCMDIK